MTRALIYTRMSLDKTGEALGVERQLEACQSLASSRGFDVVEVIRENNVSATTGKRPGYARVLDLIRSGQVQVVVVWKMDRLLRRLTDLEELIDLCEKHNAQVVTASGDVDLTNSAGRLIGRILASVARSEMETKSERHKAANSQRAKAGLPHKGRRAFGYSSDGMTVVEEEALALKEMAHRFLSGYSYTELADWLNSQGYKTAMGNKFYSVAIRQMLMRVRYKGVREHDGVLYPAAWPAILDEDTFQMVQHRIRERSASIGFRPMPRRHLLTGLVWCASCGAPMNGTTTYDRKTKEPRKTYRCNRNRLGSDGQPGCGKVSRGSVPMEWLIKEMVCYRLDSPELTSLIASSGDSVAPLLAQQAGVESRLEELLDSFTDGTLTKLEYKRAKSRATASLEAVQREIERLHYDRTLDGLVMAGESVRRRFETETDGWRRSLIELLIERIEVNPTRKLPRIQIDGKTYYFAPDAINISWRY